MLLPASLGSIAVSGWREMDPVSLSDVEAIQRLAVAMVVGAILGIERERLDRPAGLRTYMLVVEGACLFMICAILLADQVIKAGGVSDPGRIASTVVQGIGFIAAGVILDEESDRPDDRRRSLGRDRARAAHWRGILFRRDRCHGRNRRCISRSEGFELRFLSSKSDGGRDTSE